MVTVVRPPIDTANGIPFVKGHGTENDFILLPDPDDSLDVSPAQVRALCDRHAGIGADGIIRIAPAAGGAAAFVMDYRNADGSLAEMCGNGARVFARFLVDAGWSAAGSITFQTRGGLRVAQVPAAGDVSVGMGPVHIGDAGSARLDGVEFPGVAVDVGNPHLVCLTRVSLDSLDLSRSPWFDRAVFPQGVNIEFAVPRGVDDQGVDDQGVDDQVVDDQVAHDQGVDEQGVDDQVVDDQVVDDQVADEQGVDEQGVDEPGVDHVAMRVHERGVGETRSCGTGTVAVAAAHLASTGRATGTVRVSVPGGDVTVTVQADGATLTGPAVLLATGTVDRTFWENHR